MYIGVYVIIYSSRIAIAYRIAIYYPIQYIGVFYLQDCYCLFVLYAGTSTFLRVYGVVADTVGSSPSWCNDLPG